MKAVEVGQGVTAAESFGSAVHDAIGYSPEENDGAKTRFTRERNNAGGIEGGVSNGEDIVVRGYLKPISTLRRPLGSVSFSTRESTKAAYERSDVCVVPAAGVAAEAMVGCHSETRTGEFGGDSAAELSRNYQGYLEQSRILKRYPGRMVYPIVKFPDPILQRPTEHVTVFDDELRRLVDDMFESITWPMVSASQRRRSAFPNV